MLISEWKSCIHLDFLYLVNFPWHLPGHAVVASFMLDKPTSFLEDYSLRLQDDIFDEMSFNSTKVFPPSVLFDFIYLFLYQYFYFDYMRRFNLIACLCRWNYYPCNP